MFEVIIISCRQTQPSPTIVNKKCQESILDISVQCVCVCVCVCVCAHCLFVFVCVGREGVQCATSTVNLRERVFVVVQLFPLESEGWVYRALLTFLLGESLGL